MTKKKIKRPKPEFGQTLYVTIGSQFGELDDIHEYIVTKVNTVSFYALKKGSNLVRRFDLKTFSHKGTFEYHYAHFTREEIEERRILAAEKRALKNHLLKNIHNFTLPQLREMNKIVDSK
ncbi:hypothetical protein PP657_gp023 [Bacillus phage BCPST]|uniref:Uncharacterized protein n=1 Tax=Bacillus phage BCPST TaxID=2801506 RepID=A0AAE7P3H9_9CAUD|nr:hypothetical protein PP657_gp023 [Bacillus phage BCPST]QQO38641.1 hypothetical protein BCPST_023 [Bacillus phage BCPST]QSJ04231.1 hypothetical protein BCP6_026 [Bacillus phage BCP6]